MPKFTPKCPACGSPLEKESKNQSGYSCPNSECKVIKVYYDRTRRIRRIVYEGPEVMRMFGRTKHQT